MVSSYGGADKVPISKELVLRARKSNAAIQRRFKEGRRGGEGKIGNKGKGEGGSS